jgi:hypothetical protein
MPMSHEHRYARLLALPSSRSDKQIFRHSICPVTVYPYSAIIRRNKPDINRLVGYIIANFDKCRKQFLLIFKKETIEINYGFNFFVLPVAHECA